MIENKNIFKYTFNEKCFKKFGVWRSWLARAAGGRKVVRSNRITPTKN